MKFISMIRFPSRWKLLLIVQRRGMSAIHQIGLPMGAGWHISEVREDLGP